jgi:hypothetical protein
MTKGTLLQGEGMSPEQQKPERSTWLRLWTIVCTAWAIAAFVWFILIPLLVWIITR